MKRHLNTHHSMIGLVSVFAFSSAAFAESSWKLYDMRDLISALPPASDKNGETVNEPGKNVLNSALPPASDKNGETVKEPGKNVDDLLHQACGAMGIVCTRLMAGVYGIEAEDAVHARMQTLLEGVRDLYKERYAVELVLYRAAIDQAPPTGAEFHAANPSFGQRFTVSRRTSSRVTVVSRMTFLSGASPVVAQNAVAYAPEKTAVDDGLDVSVLVGTDGEDKDGTSIEVVGELRKVAWPEDVAKLETQMGGQINLRFPIVSVRSVQSHLQIKYGKPIVFSVLAGFEEGQSIILTASVRKL